VKLHVSGADPKNISEIFTQSLLSGLARRVSNHTKQRKESRKATNIQTAEIDKIGKPPT